MLYASQLTARHLDQLEQKGDLIGNHQKETEAKDALIDIIINIPTKCMPLRANKLCLDRWYQAEMTYDLLYTNTSTLSDIYPRTPAKELVVTFSAGLSFKLCSRAFILLVMFLITALSMSR